MVVKFTASYEVLVSCYGQRWPWSFTVSDRITVSCYEQVALKLRLVIEIRLVVMAIKFFMVSERNAASCYGQRWPNNFTVSGRITDSWYEQVGVKFTVSNQVTVSYLWSAAVNLMVRGGRKVYNQFKEWGEPASPLLACPSSLALFKRRET